MFIDGSSACVAVILYLLVFCQIGSPRWVDCLTLSSACHKDGGISLSVSPKERTCQFFLHAISFVLSVKQKSCDAPFVFDRLDEVLRKDPFLALYFSLFINDLPASLPSSVKCPLYADDLAILSSSPSVTSAVETTQGALFRLERWSEYWYLPLNPSKCEASFFSVDPH